MAEKQQPVGVCDFCLGEIPKADWYTSKGRPRLHCSRDCRNTANSRAGAHIIGRKNKERIERGQWQNPHHLNPPSSAEQGRRSRLGRKREVKAGTWRNPALTDEAREKLSRPRKHTDVLHTAIEKRSQGLSVTDLTTEEQEAYRIYRRELEAARREEIRAYHRARYRRIKDNMTEEQREAQRAKWREGNRRKAERKRKRTEES